MDAFSQLETELEKTRQTLVSVDDSIRKMTGPTRRGGRGRAVLLRGGRASLRGRGRGRAALDTSNIRTATQRAPSEETEQADLPNLRSQVLSVVGGRSREEALQEQQVSQEGKNRNRRMFGLLLGTLERFKTDEETHTDLAKKRRRVEQRLEEKEQESLEEMREHTRGLFYKRRLQERKLERLSRELDVVRQFKTWEADTKRLKNFIITKTKPCLYFLPAQLLPKNHQQLTDTGQLVDELISERKAELDAEIERLTQDETYSEELANEVAEVGQDHDGLRSRRNNRYFGQDGAEQSSSRFGRLRSQLASNGAAPSARPGVDNRDGRRLAGRDNRGGADQTAGNGRGRVERRDRDRNRDRDDGDGAKDQRQASGRGNRGEAETRKRPASSVDGDGHGDGTERKLARRASSRDHTGWQRPDSPDKAASERKESRRERRRFPSKDRQVAATKVEKVDKVEKAEKTEKKPEKPATSSKTSPSPTPAKQEPPAKRRSRSASSAKASTGSSSSSDENSSSSASDSESGSDDDDQSASASSSSDN